MYVRRALITALVNATNLPRILQASTGAYFDLKIPIALIPLEGQFAQLRWRHGDRPWFSVNDEHDLEDLLRAVLALHFDDVRPECRTPHYALATRTDFLLARDQTSVTAKLARPDVRGPQLAEQFREDIAYYRARGKCSALVGFVYDPQGLLPDPAVLERALSEGAHVLEAGCIIAG